LLFGFDRRKTGGAELTLGSMNFFSPFRKSLKFVPRAFPARNSSAVGISRNPCDEIIQKNVVNRRQKIRPWARAVS
jgi:hypothetical protein